MATFADRLVGYLKKSFKLVGYLYSSHRLAPNRHRRQGDSPRHTSQPQNYHSDWSSFKKNFLSRVATVFAAYG
jgi:hypothetical protein